MVEPTSSDSDEVFITTKSDLIAYRVYQKALKQLQTTVSIILLCIVPVFGFFGWKTYIDITKDLKGYEADIKEYKNKIEALENSIKEKDTKIGDTLQNLTTKKTEIETNNNTFKQQIENLDKTINRGIDSSNQVSRISGKVEEQFNRADRQLEEINNDSKNLQIELQNSKELQINLINKKLQDFETSATEIKKELEELKINFKKEQQDKLELIDQNLLAFQEEFYQSTKCRVTYAEQREKTEFEPFQQTSLASSQSFKLIFYLGDIISSINKIKNMSIGDSQGKIYEKFDEYTISKDPNPLILSLENNTYKVKFLYLLEQKKNDIAAIEICKEPLIK